MSSPDLGIVGYPALNLKRAHLTQHFSRSRERSFRRLAKGTLTTFESHCTFPLLSNIIPYFDFAPMYPPSTEISGQKISIQLLIAQSYFCLYSVYVEDTTVISSQGGEACTEFGIYTFLKPICLLLLAGCSGSLPAPSSSSLSYKTPLPRS